MRTSAFSGGSVLAAFLASFCCIGPLVLSILGIGGLGLAASFEPLRPYLIGLTVVFLGIGFYFAYRPQEVECKPGESCPAPAGRSRQRIMLWVVTILTAVLIAFPYILPYIY